jgi:hypothetical protein
VATFAAQLERSQANMHPGLLDEDFYPQRGAGGFIKADLDMLHSLLEEFDSAPEVV